jgi:hypothetical protein
MDLLIAAIALARASAPVPQCYPGGLNWLLSSDLLGLSGSLLLPAGSPVPGPKGYRKLIPTRSQPLDWQLFQQDRRQHRLSLKHARALAHADSQRKMKGVVARMKTMV